MTTTTATPELTFRAIILGLLLSVVMGTANVYLGLKAGMTVSASIPAAVVAMLILKGVFRTGTILEANQVQTAASAGESLAAGVIFTLPALVMIGAWASFDMVLTTMIAFTGGLLGILFMIPMRRVFVVADNPELKFPEGLACAAVLRAGEEDARGGGALKVVHGALVGGGFKLLGSFFSLFDGTLEAARVVGDRVLYLGGDVSPALLAVGYIVRLNVAVLIFAGGAAAWLIGIPMLGGGHEFTGNAVEGAYALWGTRIRYVGVGAMVVGGIASIVRVRHGLVEAIREIRGQAGRASGEAADPLDRDISSKAIVILSIVASVLVGIVYFEMTGHLPTAVIATFIMLIMSFFFTAVASYIVGLVGNSNSPVSGMTITAVLFTGGMLYLFHYSGLEGMVATLGVAAVVCCVACTSGDVCNDLKTGQLVGASPRRQQIMQIMGVAVAAFVMAPTLQLLHDHTPGGIGGRELSAPQAGLFASLAEGFFGEGELPLNLLIVGAIAGVLVLVIDRVLEARGSTFRAPLMPIAVGMYLPFGLSTPILLGGLFAHFFARNASDEAEAEGRLQGGILLSSGIIAGESLMGVGIALLASAGIERFPLIESGAARTALTFVAVGGLLALFYRLSRPSEKALPPGVAG